MGISHTISSEPTAQLSISVSPSRKCAHCHGYIGRTSEQATNRRRLATSVKGIKPWSRNSHLVLR